MLNVTNISNNPLQMTDETILAAGESGKLKSLGEREQTYQSRGWLRVIEDVKPDAAAESTGGKTK